MRTPESEWTPRKKAAVAVTKRDTLVAIVWAVIYVGDQVQALVQATRNNK